MAMLAAPRRVIMTGGFLAFNEGGSSGAEHLLFRTHQDFKTFHAPVWRFRVLEPEV